MDLFKDGLLIAKGGLVVTDDLTFSVDKLLVVVGETEGGSFRLLTLKIF